MTQQLCPPLLLLLLHCCLQVGLAQMLKGGVIMDVTTPEEARIAEEAGAVAVMALERVPADIRKDGGVARMSDASVIKAIKQAVTIPVMAKARIGHFVEAQVLEALDVDYIDESEVSSKGDEWAAVPAASAAAHVWCSITVSRAGIVQMLYGCECACQSSSCFSASILWICWCTCGGFGSCLNGFTGIMQ
jgi:hypothetical protein